jgi:hypothetical protein
MLISPEQLLELSSLCPRHLFETLTEDIPLTARWSAGDWLHDGELLEELREEGDHENGGRLWRGKDHTRRTYIGTCRDLMLSECLNDELSLELETANHRDDLR